MQKQMHSFTTNPVDIDGRRSIMDFTHPVHTSFNQGDLFPIGTPVEVLPGDTFKFNISAFVKMTAQPLRPVMDDAYIDIYAFFVPNRILWKHWEEEHGANKSDYWTQSTEYVEPQLFISGAGVVPKCGLLDYLGVAPGDYTSVESGVDISLLPLAGYSKIWNDWFRDQNYQAPVTLDSVVFNIGNDDGFDGDGNNFSWYYDGTFKAVQTDNCHVPLLKVNRYHDYFSSVLPAPQKGDPVTLPLGEEAKLFAKDIDDSIEQTDKYNIGKAYITQLNSLRGGTRGYTDNVVQTELATVDTNIYVDLSTATAATINDLRYAFQLQKQFEKDARGGTRYFEILKSNYGVSPRDASLQRPELIGAIHQRLGMTSVPTTIGNFAEPTIYNMTGALGAYSNTGIKSQFVLKSFEEHGRLFILGAVRVKHSYSQGIDKTLFKKRRFDYYYKTFDAIGEQPVYRKQLQALESDAEPDAVLGFQEAWAEYRYWPSQITGQLRKGNSYLDFEAYTYGDEYASTSPVTISSEWLTEMPDTIGNATVLGGNPTVGTQFVGDFYFDGIVVRGMSVHSIPGLIDHN